MTDPRTFGPRPVLRLLPAPAREPTAAPAAAPTDEPRQQGSLALDFALPSGLPAEPTVGPQLRVVRGGHRLSPRGSRWVEPGPRPHDPVRADPDGPRLTGRAELPPPGPWAARLGQAVVEVMAGDRPPGQLLRWTSEDVYARLLRGLRRAAGVDAARRSAASRATVRLVHVCEPVDGVVEAAVVVVRAQRTQALALRLEGWDGRWCCTALEVG